MKDIGALQRKGSFGVPALTVVGLLVTAPSAFAHAPGVVLSGTGSPVIDGVLSSGEWSGAGTIAFTINLPGGGTTQGTLYELNDCNDLYLAVQFARGDLVMRSSLFFDFDNDHGGTPSTSEGDDIFGINPGIGFLDGHRQCACSDTDTGGSRDGSGAFSNDGNSVVYELSHPLNSADDAHDFSLAPGQTVGFDLFLVLCDASTCVSTRFPAPCFCPDQYGDIVILPFAETEPPTIVCSSDIAVPATSPSGANVSFNATATDNCSASVVCSAVSGSTFPIGVTTVSCSATDPSANTASCTFTITVKGAADQIVELIALIQSFSLKPSTENSLIAKLQDASALLNRGNVTGACGKLGDFIAEVHTRAGQGQLTPGQADQLNQEATRIRVVLSCRNGMTATGSSPAAERVVVSRTGADLNVRYRLADSGPAVIELFDVSGRLISRGVAEPGASTHTLRLHTTHGRLSSGVYVVRVVRDRESVSQKVVLLR